MNEAPAVVDLASHLTPLSIRHGRLDFEWSVLAVLEDWTDPRYSEVAGTPLESKRFRVRVRGPLPGMSSEEGELVMIVRRYGDRDGWWIAPEMALAALVGDPNHLDRRTCPSRARRYGQPQGSTVTQKQPDTP